MQPRKTNPATGDALVRLDMSSLLVDMGFEDVDPSADQQVMFCLFHNDVGTKSFSVSLSKKVFHCFSPACGVKGNGITLYALWKNISYEKALQEILYLPIRRDLPTLQQRILSAREKQVPIAERLETLTKFIEAMPLLVETPHVQALTSRGLSIQTLKNSGLRFFDEGIAADMDAEKLFRAGISSILKRPVFFSNPILIPYYLGTSVAFIQGRQLIDDPSRSKYLGVRGSIPCLFNHGVLRSKPTNVFITEGAIDAMSMAELGYWPALGVVGVDGFHPDWAEDFKGVDNVWCAYDHDPAGEAGFLKLRELLKPSRCQVHRFLFPYYFKDINQALGAGWKPSL